MTTFSLVCNTWLAALDAMSTSHKASSLAVELKTSLILEDLFEFHVYEFQHGYITYTSLYIYIYEESYILTYILYINRTTTESPRYPVRLRTSDARSELHLCGSSVPHQVDLMSILHNCSMEKPLPRATQCTCVDFMNDQC